MPALLAEWDAAIAAGHVPRQPDPTDNRVCSRSMDVETSFSRLTTSVLSKVVLGVDRAFEDLEGVHVTARRHVSS